MKKQINPTIKAHLIRGAFYLLLLLAVCAIPFALAQRHAGKQSFANPLAAPNLDGNVYGPGTQPPALKQMPAVADSVLNHLADLPAKQAQAPLFFPQQPGGIDCNSEPGIVIHDDGIIENGYSGNPGAGVTEVRFVDKFTPTSYPATYSSVCLDFVTLAGGPANYPIDIVVYDDDGTGGAPGTLLGALNAQSLSTHLFVAGGTPTWNSRDISSLGLNITSGSVYIGARWMPPTPTNVYISADQTGTVGFAGGYWWNNNANAWATIQTAFPAYHACMIRAVQGPAGPTPTASPSPTATATATPCTSQYTIAQIGGSIVPGTTDIGNHGDDTVTTVALPFPYSLYGQSFTSVNLSSNGNAQFVTTDTTFTNVCLPWAAHNSTIFPYWDDLFLVNSGFGIFTSVSGTAPNRIFNIEWRAQYFPGSGNANFELRLYEGQSRFDVIYGTVDNGNTSATAGVQKDVAPNFTQYFCNGTGGAATGGQSYTLQPCGTPSPTPTATATATGTPTCNPAWQNEPPMTAARRNAATAVVGSNLYAITGFDLNPNYTTINERFNGTSWTTLAPIPVRHAQGRASAVGTNIYVPGGFNSVDFGGPLDTMQIYNTATNTWSAGMALPAARSGVATAAFNGLVYVIAGYNPVGAGHNDVYIYNPGTNSYTTGAPMPGIQGNQVGVLFNGEIYVVGGGTAPGAQFAYNPTTNVWRTIAALPTTGGTCQSDAGFVLNNELWVVGCLGLALNQQVWIYNPGSNSWRAGPQYNVDHQGPGAALFNGRGFVVGGGTAGGGSTAVESIGPCGPTPTASPTATATFTPTPTATATATPTAPASATPTATAGTTATPTCPPGNQYTIAQIGGSIVPGTTDIGNHGDDTVTTIALPFSYTLYDQTFTSVNLSSNGNAQFTTTDTTFTNQCLPWLTHNYTIYPYWDDLYLVNAGFGIFTSISGSAPNRIFNIEWRAQYFPGNGSANVELRLYEGQTRFDVIYGTVDNGNTSATAGVQKNDTTFTQYFCNGSGGAASGGQSYTLQGCGTPTPTATAVASGTPSATPTCAPSSFNVLIAYADSDGPPTQLQSEILAEPGVVACDLFDALNGTPTLAQLQKYQIVVPYSNSPFLDADTLGNNLADYVDGGGIVVQYGFSHYGPGQPFGINGRWVSGNYNPYNYTTNLQFAAFSLGTHNAGHPLMAGVTALNSDFANIDTPAAGATEVAQDNLGDSLVAYRPVSGGHTTVGVTAYVGFDATQSGDWGKVIVNAGRWLISGPCGTPSPTPTASGTPSATPTCPPGGSPGPWTQAAPVAIDHYGGFIDSNGTVAWQGGGYSFTTSDNVDQFGRFDPVANTWTPLAPVPDMSNAEASGVYAPNVNKLFVFGGENIDTVTVVNTTRIYDIATNTWSTGAPMPDVRGFMGSGYFNGKIYLVGGYTTGNVDPSFGQVWEYDPVLNTWNTTRMSMPVTLGGPGFGIINGHIYIAGGRNLANTNLNTLYDYDIVANTWTARANMPSGVNVPGSAVIGGKLWVFGGGNPFLGSGTAPTSGKTGLRAWFKRLFTPDTTNSLQVYDPATDSWTSGPTMNQQRSFPAGIGVGNTAVAVGGYTGSSSTASVEVNVAGGGCASPTPTIPPTATPTASPSCTPGGTPGPWSTASPYPIPVVRYGFVQFANYFYVFGGVSNGTRVNNVNRLDLTTGMWQSRAAMPFTSEAPTCALDASASFVYCTEGDTGSGFARYDLATDVWTPMASIPGGDHYGSASGAFNGKVFVAGGTTGIVNAVQVYDVATNTWSAGTAAPSAFLLAGYQQVGQFLYVVGGFSPGGPNAAQQSSVLSRGQQARQPKAPLSSTLTRGLQARQPRVPLANNTTTFRLDMSSAPGVWSSGPAFTQGRADFGVSYDAGSNKLYALGGDANGGGFFDSTNLVDELAVGSWPAGSWVASPPNLIPPNRQANQAGFYGSGQIWSVGGLEGQTFQFLAEVQRRTNGGGPCGTPTATPTATATATFTPTATATATATFTPTATATATFTPTATATATATATVPPRPTPTPRPRPTPPPHPGNNRPNCFSNSSDCTGSDNTVTNNCVDCLGSVGGMSWLDDSGCHTTCP